MSIELLALGDTSLYVDSDDHITKYLRTDLTPCHVTHTIVDEVLRAYGFMIYCDVGCNYGLELIRVAKQIYSRTSQTEIFGFDPGYAGKYVLASIDANDLTGRVRFERVALSDKHGRAAFWGEHNHSENNRLVNSNEVSHEIGNVQTVPLDYFLKDCPEDWPLVIKIDTQGSEHEVIKGGHTSLQNRSSFMTVEFTPWALAGRIDPAEYLDRLANSYTIYDLGPNRDRFDIIYNFQDLTNRTTQSEMGWTDLLFLSVQDPSTSKAIADKLANKIVTARNDL